MAKKIIWSKEAKDDFDNILAYLSEEWPEPVLESFINEMDAVILLISISPDIGLKSEVEKGVQSFLVTKHNRLFYRVIENKIELITIFDTRQHRGERKY